MSLYSTSNVDRIAREVVSEEMIDHAINKWNGLQSGSPLRSRWLLDPATRAKVRRSIAIGISCGSYSVALFEAEQALRRRVAVKA